MNQCPAFGNQFGIPIRAILIVEEDDVPFRSRPRQATRFVKQHEREQAEGFRVGLQFHQQPSEANGLAREIGPRQRRSGSCGVSLVEDEVDDREDGPDSLGQVGGGRDGERNTRIANFGLTSHDSLRHRCRCDQKRPGDFVRRQSTHLPQGEWYLHGAVDRGVAAGEDEAQPIVLDGLVRPGVIRCGDLGQPVGYRRLKRLESPAATERIDRLEPAGGDEPGARVVRDSVARPRFDRLRERFVHGFFGHVEVPEQADEGRKNAPGFGAVKPVEHRANVVRSRQLTHSNIANAKLRLISS